MIFSIMEKTEDTSKSTVDVAVGHMVNVGIYLLIPLLAILYDSRLDFDLYLECDMC